MKYPVEQYPYRKMLIEVTVPNIVGFRSWLVASAIHMLAGVIDVRVVRTTPVKEYEL